MAVTLTPLIGFIHTERLWLLILLPVLVLLYVGLLYWRRNRSSSRPRSRLEMIMPRQKAWKRHIAVLFAVLSLGTLTVAFAEPKDEVQVPRERATVVIVIDVSRSMIAEDIEPNRLAAAKSAAVEFLDILPSGFNVSLVRFAAAAAIVVPPTQDRGVVAAAIERLQVAPSTATGEGIYSALDAISQAPPDPDHPDEPAPGAIVLLSDGSKNAGRPANPAAKEAKEKGIPIFTIAYGTEWGYIVEDGHRSPVPVNHNEMLDIARLSGGQKFEAGSTQELREVYQDIAESVGYVWADQEVTEQYAGYALAFAILAALAAMSLAARWP